MSANRVVVQYLKHLLGAGVTHLPTVDFSSLLSASAPRRSAAVTPTSRSSAVRSSPRSEAPAATPVESTLIRGTSLSPEAVVLPEPLTAVREIVADAVETVEGKTDALCQLAGVVAQCQRCEQLARTRKQTVFGVGNPDARIMFIGEAPGADEDTQGEPFVGKAGQLLNRIIQASQLKREDLYICNILRCRPPGNRTPQPQEAANCREFLDAQIRIVRPEYIICWGTVAAQNLLGETSPVGRLRGRFFDYQGIRVMCTYHPSYLLRTESAKKLVWDDMKLFMKQLGVDL